MSGTFPDEPIPVVIGGPPPHVFEPRPDPPMIPPPPENRTIPMQVGPQQPQPGRKPERPPVHGRPPPGSIIVHPGTRPQFVTVANIGGGTATLGNQWLPITGGRLAPPGNLEISGSLTLAADAALPMQAVTFRQLTIINVRMNNMEDVVQNLEDQVQNLTDLIQTLGLDRIDGGTW